MLSVENGTHDGSILLPGDETATSVTPDVAGQAAASVLGLSIVFDPDRVTVNNPFGENYDAWE